MLFNAAIAILSAAVGASGLSVTELYRFPNETFIENLAFAPDGTILLNTFGEGRVYNFDPSAKNPEPHLVVEVPGLNAITGIAEIASAVFAVTGVNRREGFDLEEGSCKIATFNLNDVCDGDAPPRATILADVPEAGLLNGMVALPHKQHIILSADSIFGRIFRTDTSTGEVDISFEHEMLGVGPQGPVPLGVNGLVIYDDYLYFTNSNRQFFARARINYNGDVVGDPEVVFQLRNTTRLFDDFDMSRDGDAYISLELDSLVKITNDREMITLISPGGKVELFRPTATLLSPEERTLFVVTAGLEDDERGQIIRVDLDQ